MSTLTFLYPSAGQPARKAHRIIRTAAGERLETVPYGRAMQFRHESVELTDADALYAALCERSGRNYFAVLGTPRPGAGTVIYRRTHGDHADLVETATRFVAVDIDNEPAPDDIDTGDILAVGDYLRARLPAELCDVSCVVQLTAGHGLDRWRAGPRLIKARLWFVLGTPRLPAELRAWMRARNRERVYVQMDPSVASAAQPIYTAAPLFDGMADPVPQRLALLLGGADTADIEPVACAPALPAAVHTGAAVTAGGRHDAALLARLAARITRAAERGEPRHPAIIKTATLAGGYIATGALDELRAVSALAAAAVATGSSNAVAAVRAGVAAGKARPLQAPDAATAAEEDAELPDEPATGDLPAWLAWLARCPEQGKRRAVARVMQRSKWRAPWRMSWAELRDAVAAVAPEHAGFAGWLAEQQHIAAAALVPDIAAAELEGAGIVYHRHASIDAARAAIEAQPGAVHLVRAPHGAGKTERILQPVAAASSRPVAVTHRVSLVADIATRLQLTNYQTVKGPQAAALLGDLALCLPSLANPKYAPFLGVADALLVDEIHAVLTEIYAVAGVLKARAPAVETALVRLLAQCRTAVGVDAGLTTADCLQVQRLAAGRPVVVHDVVTPAAPGSCQWLSRAALETRILAAAAAGETMRIVCDSAAEVERTAALIAAAAPGLRVLAIHSAAGTATAGSDDAAAFLADCNRAAAGWDVVIHSPTVESGVSLTVPHFRRTFCLFSGASVAPDAYLQMMRRDRTAQRWELAVTGPGVASLPADAGDVLLTLDATRRHSATLFSDATGCAVARIAPATEFDKTVCDYTAAANARKNLAAQQLWYACERAGIVCERVDDDERPDLTAHRAVAAAVVEQDYRAAVLGAEVLTDEARAAAEVDYQPTPATAAAVERYDACDTLRCDPSDLDADGLALYARGALRGWLRNWRLMTAGATADAEAADAELPATQRRYPLATAEALRQVCELLDIDPATGRGDFDAADAAAAYAALASGPCRWVLEARGYARFTARPPRDPVKWVGGILKRCGLALVATGNTARRYHIDPDRRCDAAGRVSAAGWTALAAVADAAVGGTYIGPEVLLGAAA